MAETVHQQFPHQELTALSTTENPNNAALTLLQKEINANAMSIPSVRGGGAHGHLALTMTPAAYLAISGIAFAVPIHPGPAPIHPNNATGPVITEINRQYTADLKEFNVYLAVEANLKKQLIQAVPDTYINELKDELLGYANATTLTLITHLFDTYGTVTADDLNKNLEDLNHPWSSSQPLEDLWKQIRICRLFAQAHDPISEAMAVRSAITNLENSGVFIDTIKDWRKLGNADHTMIRLKALFNAANRERLRQLTTGNVGYQATQQHALAATGHPSGPAPALPQITEMFYCWSHGLGSNPNHTSATCKKPAPGHRIDSTVTDMYGGCNKIHRRRGETAVFKPPAPKEKE
jgi:hypothetical protein